jgi:hypothetical protein
VLNEIGPWARGLLQRRRLEREMQEEMAQHLERATERLMARGLSEREARHTARREFGNVTGLQEEGRVARGWRWMDALREDVRFALRQFARKPATTLTIIGVLTVGMSVSTALFSLLHAYSTQPPPGVPHAEDLVRIRGSQRTMGPLASRGFSQDEFTAYQNLTTHFSAVTGWTDREATIDRANGSESGGLAGVVTYITANYFTTLGVRPVLGAGIAQSSFEPGAPPAGVISHAAWESRRLASPGCRCSRRSRCGCRYQRVRCSFRPQYSPSIATTRNSAPRRVCSRVRLWRGRLRPSM